jgi:two-component system, chemotaxis family, protein-glutamate methylesterase/glutaminase
MPVRDIVVIGGSAGAVEGILRIARALPAALAARVFLVIHVPPTAPSVLPRLLERSGPLRARHPRDGDATEPSIIYVAPPDHHLLVRSGAVGVVRGPRENGHRPAVDPLFRSACAAYGSRVIAVVLSGNLDDGSAGLRAVADSGGATVVQDPTDAVYPSMPQNALEMVPDADVVPLDGIPDRIVQLVGTPAPGAPPVKPKPTASRHAAIDPVELEPRASEALSERGEASGFTCPECHGAIFEVDARGVPRYRCRVGHAYSDESLLAAQNGSLEAALWAALRALEEGGEMSRRLVERAEQRGASRAAQHFAREARTYAERARIVRLALDAPEPGPTLGADEARAVM